MVGALVRGLAVAGLLTAVAASGGSVGEPVVPTATEQACRFDVFQELVPPEVHHSCAPGHGRHRALAVCELENLVSSGERRVVQGPWTDGGRTSVAACGVNEKLVDWGAEGGG